MNRILSTASTLMIAGTLALVGTQSASAAVTPGVLSAESTLYVFECDEAVSNDIVSIDPATGETTVVGSSTMDECWSGASYNAADGQIYVISVNDWTDPYTLYSVNPTTGVFTTIGNLPNGISAGALAIAPDGTAYLIDWEEELYSIDLTDASVTSIAQTDLGSGGDIYAFAINPVDGNAYVVRYGGDNKIFEVDLTDGTATEVGANITSTTVGQVCALAFDENGTAWIQGESNTSELWSGDITDFAATAELQSQFLNPADTNDPFYAEAIALVYGSAAPANLADTGVSASNLAIAAATAFGAIAGGVALAARRARRNEL